MRIAGKERPMVTIVAVAGFLVLLALSGADLMVSGISPDELHRMGLEQES